MKAKMREIEELRNKINNAIYRFEEDDEYGTLAPIDVWRHTENIMDLQDQLIKTLLDKQEPKKRLFDGVDTYLCPVCEEEVEDNEYCSNCGQRLEF